MKINLLEYKNWLGELKQQIRNSQIKTALSVNKALIALYWDLGKQISEKQRVKGWGSKVVNQLSADLCSEFKGVTGFSRSNLYAMKQFYEFVHQFGGQTETSEIVHQLGGQLEHYPEIVEKYCFNLPWRHIVLLLQRIKDEHEMKYYMNETIDLLFYHLRLHCYVVVELKVGEFEPEYLGKMNFYLSAVDTLLKTEGDSQTIGILLCKNQNSLDVEFALRDINKPIGVSEFTFKELPATIQSQMPSEEELNNELLKFNHITNQ
jgi:predicted nuclease of restriction endonuclease-like (RecB) superfamily